MTMNKLQNIGYSLLLFLIPIISLAQRADRFSDIKEQGIDPGYGTPIDQYEIALIVIAISIVAFFAYRLYKSKQIAK